jgi:hypothetical protein
MSNLLNSIAGPLDKNSCTYFLAWTIFFFIVLLFVFIAQVIILFKNYKNLSGNNILNALSILINIFLAYFVNRLLLTMCNKSLA